VATKAKKRAVLALDPGKARVGVAVSDELGILAHPRPPLDASDRKKLLAAIAEIAKEENVGRVLVGLPLDMSGATGPSAKRAMTFAQAVADATGLDVELVDERLTTVEAARRLKEAEADKAKKIDGAAAALLLQAWLERKPK
jgi:putative Holliday junction resolvase